MCSAYNRTGLLCSRCGGDLGPAVLSIFSKCLECHEYGWAFFILLTFVPTTLFSLVIIISTTSPNLNIIIVWCQFFSNITYLNPGNVHSFIEYPHVFQYCSRLSHPFVGFVILISFDMLFHSSVSAIRWICSKWWH